MHVQTVNLLAVYTYIYVYIIYVLYIIIYSKLFMNILIQSNTIQTIDRAIYCPV